MNFFLIWTLFLLIGLMICFLFGPAMVLVYGIVFVFIYTCIGELNKTKTLDGRKQIQKELKIERKIEEYWGNIEYWDK